jgi:23S rRNA pseudouridine1911/1915/1917 synthase
MIRVILEYNDFLVVEKPAGISTQPISHSPSPTLAHLVAEQFPEIKTVGGTDWGAVHRLDRDTSGLVIFARNEETYRYFREEFSKNRVEREYLAIVEGVIEKKGKIDWPIGPDPKSSKRVKVYKNIREARRNKAQEATTIYSPLHPAGEGPGVRGTLLKIQIKTGRRHQIRAHLAAIGHPVLRLHASRLKFRHPRRDRWVEAASASFSAKV